MPELIVPPQHDLTHLYRERRSSVSGRRNPDVRSGVAPVIPKQISSARSSQRSVLGSVLCGLMTLSLITAGLAVLLTGLVPALFLAVALLLVGLSPILLVWLGILLTDGVEFPEQKPKWSGRPLDGLPEHRAEKQSVFETWES
jgi:hypothetical protein